MLQDSLADPRQDVFDPATKKAGKYLGGTYAAAWALQPYWY